MATTIPELIDSVNELIVATNIKKSLLDEKTDLAVSSAEAVQEDVGYIRETMPVVIDKAGLVEDALVEVRVKHEEVLLASDLAGEAAQMALENSVAIYDNVSDILSDGRPVVIGSLLSTMSGAVFEVISNPIVDSVARTDGVNLYPLPDYGSYQDNVVGGVPLRYITEKVQLPRYHGLRGDGTPETVALQNMFDVIAGDNLSLEMDARDYAFEGRRTFSGRHLKMRAGARLVLLSDDTSGLKIDTPSGLRVEGLNVVAPNSYERKNGNPLVRFDDVFDFDIYNPRTEKAVSASLAFFGGGRGRIYSPYAKDGYADALHFTKGARDIDVFGPCSDNCGDDSVAVVSYITDGVLCENIRTFGGNSRGSRARGWVVAGGRNVRFYAPTIEGSYHSAVLFVLDDTHGCYGTENCVAIDPVGINCGTGSVGYAVMQVASSQPTLSDSLPSGEVYSRATRNCGFIRPIIRGANNDVTAGIGLNYGSEHCFVEMGNISNLRRPDSVAVPAVFHNGKNNEIRGLRVNNVGGQVVTYGTSASGTIKERDVVAADYAQDSVNKAARSFNTNSVDFYDIVGTELSGTSLGVASGLINVDPKKYSVTDTKYNNTLVADTPRNVGKFGSDFRIDLSSGGTRRKISYSGDATTTETISVICLAGDPITIEWFASRNAGQLYQHQKDRWNFIVSGQTGTNGVDYVPVTLNGQAGYFQRTNINVGVSAAANTLVWSCTNTNGVVMIRATPQVNTSKFSVEVTL